MKKIIFTLVGFMLLGCSYIKSMEYQLSITDAALSNHMKLVEMMICSGVNPNECELEGEGAPIFAFIFKQNKKALKKLIKRHKVNINLSDPMLGTPLTYALTMKRFDIAQFLVKLGADVNFPDTYGVIPIDKLREYDLLDKEYETKDGASTATSRSNTPQKKPADEHVFLNPFELHQKLLDLAI